MPRRTAEEQIESPHATKRRETTLSHAGMEEESKLVDEMILDPSDSSFSGEELNHGAKSVKNLTTEGDSLGSISWLRNKIKVIEEAEEFFAGFKSKVDTETGELRVRWDVSREVQEFLVHCELLLRPITEFFPTPSSRVEVSDMFESIFSIISKVVLELGDFPDIVALGCYILGKIAPGPRVSSIQRDSDLHPSKCLFKNRICTAGALPKLSFLVTSSNDDVRRQALFALNEIATNHSVYREAVIACGAPEQALQLVEAALSSEGSASPFQQYTQLMENALSLLATLSRVPLQLSDPLSVYSALKEVLRRNDVLPATLQYALIGLSSMIPAHCDRDVLEHICQLLSHQHTVVLRSSILAVKVAFQSGKLDDPDLVSVVASIIRPLLVSSASDVKMSACDLIKAMCHNPLGQEVIVARNLSEVFVERFLNDLPVSAMLAEVLSMTTRSDPAVVIKFFSQDFFLTCFSRIRDFWRDVHTVKSSNGKLVREVKQRVSLVRHLLVIIENILDLDTGLMEGYDAQFFRPSLFVNRECIDDIKLFYLGVLRMDESDGFKLYEKEFRERVKRILIKILRIRSSDPGLVPLDTSELLPTIQHFLQDYLLPHGLAELSARSNQDVIHLKIVEQDYERSNTGWSRNMQEARVLTVLRSIKLAELYCILDSRYQYPTSVFFWDQGVSRQVEEVRIDSDSVLQHAFDLYLRTPDHPPYFRVGVTRCHDYRRDVAHLSDAQMAALTQEVDIYSLLEAGDDSSLSKSDAIVQLQRFAQRQVTHGLLEEIYEQFDVSKGVDINLFRRIMEALGHDNALKVDQYFKAFDEDGDGVINVSEIVSGISCFVSASWDDKVQLMFRAYDLDRSGYIDRSEMSELYRSINMFYQGVDPDPDIVAQSVEDLFNEIDKNGDGKISLDVRSRFMISLPPFSSIALLYIESERLLKKKYWVVSF